MFERYSVKMDKDVFKRAKEFSKERGYSSLKEFVQHVVIKEMERVKGEKEVDSETKNRLKGLGYISK